eukprot:7139288-Alexandrium_andersonii.AAC.1
MSRGSRTSRANSHAEAEQMPQPAQPVQPVAGLESGGRSTPAGQAVVGDQAQAMPPSSPADTLMHGDEPPDADTLEGELPQPQQPQQGPQDGPALPGAPIVPSTVVEATVPPG